MYVVGITGKCTILEVVGGTAKQFCEIDDSRFTLNESPDLHLNCNKNNCIAAYYEKYPAYLF